MPDTRPQQATVSAIAHHAPERDEALELVAGESVRVGHRSEAYPAFSWCTGPSGSQGWVPETYLAREAPELDTATVLHDYSSHELTVEPGDHLVVLGQEGGWLRCRRADGDETGWVPKQVTEPAS
jgi:hypothetical protein